jgi:murein DD-endopeptidase MepM/ murein hydrolase activator NlpD
MRLPALALAAIGLCACAPAGKLAAPAGVSAPTSQPRDIVEMKDLVLTRINAGDAPGLWELYDAPMRRAVSLDGTRSFVRGVLAARGALRASVRAAGECADDHGTWRVQADQGAWKLSIQLDGERRISGLLLVDPPPPEPAVAQSDVPMGLPFQGEWLVRWGGDRKDVNHHVGVPDQRRAADLLVVAPDGSSHKGDGKSNTDYFAYGQEIRAVADGTVVTVVDGVPENVPGAENGYAIKGNFVIVRHAPKLFSLYAHLQPRHARVVPGDFVRRGAVLGLCGNSGHSTEPHLHFQLQDGPDDNTSWGVEPVFDAVVVTRAAKTHTLVGYTFLKDDLIRE